MKASISIRVKALFLLIVFGLNTIVSFACSIGVNMGFNAPPAPHGHAFTHAHEQRHGSAHHQHKKHAPTKPGQCRHNCCSDKVVHFAKTDKTVPASVLSIVSPVFLASFISTFYTDDWYVADSDYSQNRYALRSYHPPIPDIRIAIQSFQI